MCVCVCVGVAFRDLECSVYAAVSFTGTGSEVLIRDGGIESIARFQQEALEREREVARIIKDYGIPFTHSIPILFTLATTFANEFIGRLCLSLKVVSDN